MSPCVMEKYPFPATARIILLPSDNTAESAACTEMNHKHRKHKSNCRLTLKIPRVGNAQRDRTAPVFPRRAAPRKPARESSLSALAMETETRDGNRNLQTGCLPVRHKAFTPRPAATGRPSTGAVLFHTHSRTMASASAQGPEATASAHLGGCRGLRPAAGVGTSGHRISIMGDMWARQQIHTWVSGGHGGGGGSQKPGLVDTKGDPGPRDTHKHT